MRRAFLVVVLLCCLPLLRGCGTGLQTPRETVPLGGNTLTPVTPGETFTYAFVLDNATNGVRAEGTIDGLSVPYSDANITGAVAEVLTATSTRRTQNGWPIDPWMETTTTVYGRDTTGYTSLVLARGKNGTIKYVTSPQDGEQCWPVGGSIQVGLSHSTGPVSFDDGSSESTSSVVTGVETIDVPCGRFETYRIEYSCTQTDASGTGVESGTSWVHPKVGLIRQEFTFRLPNGVSTGVRELQATNVPLYGFTVAGNGGAVAPSQRQAKHATPTLISPWPKKLLARRQFSW